MYGEAGRGKGHAQRRGNGGGDGDWKNQKSRLQMALEEDAHEATLGYANFTEGDERLGWLMNVAAVRTTPSMDIPTNDIRARRSRLTSRFSRARARDAIAPNVDRPAPRRKRDARDADGDLVFRVFEILGEGARFDPPPDAARGDPPEASRALPRSATRRAIRVAASPTPPAPLVLPAHLAPSPRHARVPKRARHARRGWRPSRNHERSTNADERRFAFETKTKRNATRPDSLASKRVFRRPPCKTPRRRRSSAR